jgi:hypothetical protein
MQFIPYERIHVKPNRARRLFNEEDIDALAGSIASLGLFHPIIVRYVKDAGVYELVAGERRLRAIKLLIENRTDFECNGTPVPLGEVPTTYLSKLPPDQVLEAELEENVRRVDLTWQERDEAYSRLHTLRSEQATGEGRHQTLSDTAAEIGVGGQVNATYVRDSIALSEHFHDPQIRNAPSRDEALKRLRDQKLAELISIRSAHTVESEHRIIQAPFTTPFEGAGKVACIVTDPPYGISADKFGDQTQALHTYSDSPHAWRGLMEEFFRVATEVTAGSSHLYLLCPIEQWFVLVSELVPPPWTAWPRPLIWDKGNQGLLPQPQHGPRYVYDAILFASRGRRPTTGVYPDVVRVDQLHTLVRGGQKPIRLYSNLLQRSCYAGDLVWDPFGGTGPILRAATELGLRAVMHEIDPAAIALAKTLKGDKT